MKMKCFDYMLEDDAEKTISQKGSNVRKKIRPLFRQVLKLGNKLELIQEKKEFDRNSTDRPVIYVCSHGFKDDVLNSILTIKDHSYVVFGNIDLFFNTFDGLCLWIYGTQLVDRYNPESKKAMKSKMNKMIEYGNNVIIFPEATWNMSPNNLIEKLHGGFYDVALSQDALVVPVITHKVGKKCYSSVLEAIDIKKVSKEDFEEIIMKMYQYLNMALDNSNNCPILEGESESLQEISDLIKSLSTATNEEEQNRIFSLIEESTKKLKNKLKGKLPNVEDEFDKNVSQYVITCISRIGYAKKEVMVNKVRDIMASEKWRMYEEHPDKTYQQDGCDDYTAWDKYLKDTISGTPYFYPEPEATTLYDDPLISKPDDVFSIKHIESDDVKKLMKKK